MTSFSTPAPRRAIADPSLVRPEWGQSSVRDPKKLWLDKNENTDPALHDLVRRALENVPTEAHWTYPDLAQLYRKLAAHVGVGVENLILAAGSDGIIRSVYEAYVDPGAGVVYSRPTFAMYEVYARMHGARAHPIDYTASQGGPILPLDVFMSTIAQNKPRLVCLPNPDSPTGTVLDPAALRRLIECAGMNGAIMLVDEAYFPFYPESIVHWIADYPHLIVARSTGKAWGMAGLRIGYGVASPEVSQVLHKVRPMYEVNTVAAWVFERMLDHEVDMLASVARLNRGKESFLNAMDSIGLRTLRGAGNFLHVGFGEHESLVHAALVDHVYYRRAFSHPSLAGFSRFSAATSEQYAPIVTLIRDAILQGGAR